MKHLIIKLIVFCALTFGAGSFAPPEMASATPSVQTSLTVHVGTSHGYWRHHHRRHHHHW